MGKLSKKLANLIITKPKLMIALIMFTSVICAIGLPKIKINMGNDVFISPHSKVYKDTETYQKKFGGDNAYVLIESKDGSIITHDNFKQIKKLEDAVGNIDHITHTTSLISILNEQLKSTASKQLTEQENLSSEKITQLKKDIQINLSTQDNEDIQKNVMASLTPEQQQKIASFVQTLLTPSQLQELIKQGTLSDIQSILTPEQQTKVQEFIQSNLTKEQQITLANDVIKRLPPVEKMTTELLQDLLVTDGKVNRSFADLLPQNGKFALVIASFDGTDMDMFTEVTQTMNKVIKKQKLKNLDVRLAGQPIVIGEIKNEVIKTMAIMLGISLLLMILILLGIFPVRRRLLSLVFVLIGLIWTFGIMGWFNIALTLATMATLPIIIGLGTDFGVQFQNRYEEEYRKNANVKESITKAISTMGPAVGTALIVMVFAFLTMFLSKAPMMQQFGLTLAIGVVAVYIVELILMFSFLCILDRKNIVLEDKHSKESFISKLLKNYALFVTKHAKIIVFIGVVLAGLGFYVEHKIPVETDLLKMIPQKMTALKDTKYLQKQVGSTTFLTYLVESDDVTGEAALQEIDDFANKEKQKYSTIESAETLVSTIQSLNNHKELNSQQQIDTALSAVPSIVKDTFLSKNKQYTQIQFKVDSSLSSNEQNNLMKKISADANKTTFKHINKLAPAGSQIMMLTAIDNISSNRELMMFAGLAIIVIILALVYRSIQLALLPTLPIIAVLGLSPLTLYLLDTSYNPLTLGLSALVLGIGTEFTILILERYKEEIDRGVHVKDAVIHAVQSVGQAITVSGLTVIGGFAAIIFVSFPVLSSFGLITVLDTAYSLISALTLLPAIIILTQKDNN